MAEFDKQVAAAIKKYQRRLRAVAKESVQKTVQIASTVEGDGGRMRVKTGFLWHSVAANIGAIPVGESSAPAGTEDNSFTYTGEDVAAALIKWDLKQSLYVGWLANYAIYREYYDGFVKGATERWQETVSAASARARKRI
jgi:hypothetical protein